jgi:hypothetical protein
MFLQSFSTLANTKNGLAIILNEELQQSFLQHGETKLISTDSQNKNH